MLSSMPDSNKKFSEAGATTGIPVSSSNPYYSHPQDHGNSQMAVAPPYQLPPRAPGLWSSGLFDCFADPANCCMTFWCPCITFGQIADIVDQGATSCAASGALYTLILYVIGCPCVYSCFYRSRMRQQYTLDEGPCDDCLVHFFCEQCALCQEYRELQSRGFNMSIGWHGNMVKRNQGVAMTRPAPPTVEEGMSRDK